MITAAVGHPYHHIGLAMGGKGLEKILHKVSIQLTAKAPSECDLKLKIGPAAEIDSDNRQRFVHGIDEKTGPVDASFVSQSPDKQLPEHNATIFDQMMLIDMQVPACLQTQIETSVLGKGFDHMIEKTYRRLNTILTLPIDSEIS